MLRYSGGMDTAVESRPTRNSPTNDRQDLRAWIAQLRAAGEVQDIAHAEREKEIGGIVDIYQRQIGNKAVLFDDVPGFPRGHRILANILTSIRRINITLGLDPDASALDLVHYWRRYMKEAKAIPPVTVKSGPLTENVRTGSDIDIFKIPVPRWHEHDGGYYIGTGDMVIMRDPDSGWINYGAYRVQAQEPNVATVMFSKGKHGDLIKRRYHERGEPCPIAVVCGMHPALFMIAGLEIPYGKNEYDAAGGLIGEPVEVIAGPRTGLPIPAHAEIAFEGFIHPNDLLDEGPLGEWTGYYAGGLKKEPAIRIETFMHRNDPILLGAIPGIPPDDDSFYRGTYRSGAVWNRARSRRGARGEGCVGPCRGRQPALAHRCDQAAICRPRQAGRPHRFAVSRRRLRQSLRRRRRRRHRPRRHRQGGVGDVHAVRSARRHGDITRLLEFCARSDGLCQRRSA